MKRLLMAERRPACIMIGLESFGGGSNPMPLVKICCGVGIGLYSP